MVYEEVLAPLPVIIIYKNPFDGFFLHTRGGDESNVCSKDHLYTWYEEFL